MLTSCSNILGKESLEVYNLAFDKDRYDFEVEPFKKSTILMFIELKNNAEINFVIKENAEVKLVLFVKGDHDYKFNADIHEYATLNFFTTDSNKDDSTIEKSVNLLGVEARLKAYEYLAANSNKLYGYFRVNHLSRNTYAETILNYLSNHDGYINRDVVSTIEKNMDNSNSSEEIKGLILSEKSRIDAKPVLVISCDDVHASHGCAIGTVDANEIYYLMSRGLTREDALRIICKSLVNPILREITDEDFLSLVKPLLLETIGE